MLISTKELFRSSSHGNFHLGFPFALEISYSGWSLYEPSVLTQVRGMSVKGFPDPEKEKNIGNFPEQIGGNGKPVAQRNKKLD